MPSACVFCACSLVLIMDENGEWEPLYTGWDCQPQPLELHLGGTSLPLSLSISGYPATGSIDHKSNINLILACAALHPRSRNHCSRPVTSRGGELILCIAFRDGTGSEKNRPCKLPRWLPLVVSANITSLASFRAKPGPQLWHRAELYGNERRHCVTV